MFLFVKVLKCILLTLNHFGVKIVIMKKVIFIFTFSSRSTKGNHSSNWWGYSDSLRLVTCIDVSFISKSDLKLIPLFGKFCWFCDILCSYWKIILIIGQQKRVKNSQIKTNSCLNLTSNLKLSSALKRWRFKRAYQKQFLANFFFIFFILFLYHFILFFN